jgi:hypothetical protein
MNQAFVILAAAVTGVILALLITWIIKRLQLRSLRKRIADMPRIQVEIGVSSITDLQDRCVAAGVPNRNNLFWCLDLLERDGDMLAHRWMQNFVVIRIKDLGFTPTDFPSTAQVFAKLALLGLHPCPSETAFEFLIQHPESIQEGMVVECYMRPLSDHKFRNRLFRVSRKNGILDVEPGKRSPDTTWYDEEFVIAKV